MIKPRELLDLLLAADGQEWFLTVTPKGRAEVTSSPQGEVIGKIECHQPEKSSSVGSTTTLPEIELDRISQECDLPALISR